MYTPKVYSIDFAINRKYEKKYKVRRRSDWIRENDTLNEVAMGKNDKT